MGRDTQSRIFGREIQYCTLCRCIGSGDTGPPFQQGDILSVDVFRVGGQTGPPFQQGDILSVDVFRVRRHTGPPFQQGDTL